ncbi:GRAK protein, partial [Thalassarche chlororhynchos]|nr:GRAK protein [Thalassarche chlororhynchos]
MTSHLLALLFSLIAVILPPRYDCTDIIGGHVVHPHSWPFMASIQTRNSIVCGGAFVEKQWQLQLTAAHCTVEIFTPSMCCFGHLQNKSQAFLFGIKGFFGGTGVSHSSVNGIFFSSFFQLNGIAKLNKYVQLLHLPDSCEDIKAGTTCKVAGWGLTSSRKPSKYLWKKTLKIVGRKSCESKHGNYTKITSNMLCAVGKNKFLKSDACWGDSGGPSICASQYSGIVSFGRGCGRRDMSGVYTRLTEKYIDWIKK